MLKRLENITKVLSILFVSLTTIFWIWLCLGSWQDEIRPNVPGQGNGCGEFDLKVPIGGHFYSPDPKVITKYTNGYFLLNRGSFDFETHRNGKKVEGGTVVIWLNPFNASLTVYYKIRSVSGLLKNEYREKGGLRFEWKSGKCS